MGGSNSAHHLLLLFQAASERPTARERVSSQEWINEPAILPSLRSPGHWALISSLLLYSSFLLGCSSQKYCGHDYQALTPTLQ